MGSRIKTIFDLRNEPDDDNTIENTETEENINMYNEFEAIFDRWPTGQ